MVLNLAFGLLVTFALRFDTLLIGGRLRRQQVFALITVQAKLLVLLGRLELLVLSLFHTTIVLQHERHIVIFGQLSSSSSLGLIVTTGQSDHHLRWQDLTLLLILIIALLRQDRRRRIQLVHLLAA